jgi:outer membrane immunogenic protein
MKRILIAGALAVAATGQAFAADLPPPMAPPPRAPATYVPAPIPYYNWGGIYVGINGGYDFGTVSPAGGGSFNTNGFLAGGTAGFNYQWAAIVAGIEGDFDYNSVSTGMPTGGPLGSPFASGGTFTSRWLATARGRLGYAFDRVLIFATGGAAFAPASIPGASTTMTGWTGGGGVEVALAPNWTAKAEYLYVYFPSPSLAGTTFKDTENVIRAGINFKFNL